MYKQLFYGINGINNSRKYIQELFTVILLNNFKYVVTNILQIFFRIYLQACIKKIFKGAVRTECSIQGDLQTEDVQGLQ